MSENQEKTAADTERHRQTAAQAITASALLGSAIWLLPFNVLFSAVGIYVTDGEWSVVIPLLLTLWITYLHLRIAFDKAIFQQFSRGLSVKAFDEVLVALKLRKTTPERGMTERCAGAVRLLKQLAFSTFLQALFIVF